LYSPGACVGMLSGLSAAGAAGVHGMTWAGERHADTSREASTTVATCPTPSRRSKSFLYRVFPMSPLRRSRRLVLPREPRAPRARVRERRAKRARTPHLASSLQPRRTHVCLPPRRTQGLRALGARCLGARLLQVLRPCQVFLLLPPLPPAPPVVSPPSSSTGYVFIHAPTSLVIYRILLLPRRGLASSCSCCVAALQQGVGWAGERLREGERER
jgi:hypothetical protein